MGGFFHFHSMRLLPGTDSVTSARGPGATSAEIIKCASLSKGHKRIEILVILVSPRCRLFVDAGDILVSWTTNKAFYFDVERIESDWLLPSESLLTSIAARWFSRYAIYFLFSRFSSLLAENVCLEPI